MCTQHIDAAHLTQAERLCIEALIAEGVSFRAISRSLQIDASVISRECARNRESEGKYCALSAQKKADERRKRSKRAARKIENDIDLAEEIERLLRGDNARGDWSPEVIAHTLCKGRISHTAIYAWIQRSRRDLRCFLPHRDRRRGTYGAQSEHGTIKTTNPRSIDDRPVEIMTRTIRGHYEGDTVRLKEGCIGTLVERMSRFLIAFLIMNRGPGLSWRISEATVSALSPFPPPLRRTITYDQGSEFAWWDEIEKGLPGTTIYFAHPYHPWERGTNERTNGLVRRYFPKGEKFATLTDTDIARVVWRLNHRPRRILHWRTPCEAFGSCCISNTN